MTPRILSILAVSAAVAVPTLAQPAEAHADGVRVRVRGGVSISGGVSVRVGGPRVRVRRVRPVVRPRRIVVGGYYGFYFASPPPAYHHDDCYSRCYHGPVRTYRPAAVHPGPSIPVAAPVAATAVAPLRPLSRFSVGVAVSGLVIGDVDADAEGSALFGRLRISDPLQVEIEISEAEYGERDRTDRRFGGALVLDLSPRAKLAGFLVGGAGVVETELGDGFAEAERGYAEVGGGVRWSLTRRFSLEGDLRIGAIGPLEDDDELYAAVPSNGDFAALDDREEAYSRMRVSAVLAF